jgi:hypothetical protein
VPDYTEMKVPFTASPYYDFLDAFLLGLKLETYVDYSTECIDAVCYTMDDWIYLENNYTLTTRADFYGPALNVSAMIAGNFTDSVVECYNFGYSFYTYG